MARRAKHTFTLPTGQTVGYSLKKRGKYQMVIFAHPTEAGKYVEVTTGSTTENDAHTSAAKIVLKHYQPLIPTNSLSTNWQDAIALIEQTPDLRPDSILGYLKAIRAFRSVMEVAKLPKPITKPSEVTLAYAQKFKRDYLNGTFKRGKSSDARTYKRSATTCTTALRLLRSIWTKYFKPNGFVSSNPWLEVPYPNDSRTKRVRMPEEKSVSDLMTWLDQRYPDWPLPKLFVQVKSISGCRTLDLCKTLSSSLLGNVLTLTAEVTKTRAARSVPLPSELTAKLHEIKGKTWLWERSFEDCKVHRPSTKNKSREYEPRSWMHTVQNFFREFNEGREKADRLRPHDLRARAITLIAASTQSVDVTSQAMGVDPQTARHYLEASKAFKGSEVFEKLSSILVPNPQPQKTSEQF